MVERPGLTVGQKVPEFVLDTYNPAKGKFDQIRFSELKDKKRWTILFFYPADFTFVCATEFAALAEQHRRFDELGAELITVSTDTNFVHLAWQRDEMMLKNVKYQMGADRTGSLSRMFGVLDEATGHALRGTFIISPDGTVLNHEVNFYNLGRNIDELMRKFRANLHLAKHGAEACPAKWKEEGDKTLNPSESMVGKVHEALNG